ncbi:hypothetical protein J4E90_003695 [Alternaria incomplexa]|uniref:uncharacterized protein n=1 Tax=Alternaria incomplexa TaxID=1187928 RepID=UPI0022203C58|nr:uncharacterized protein J4E90_003695 [Alternaria incomplexa]KAI4917188.1 hypothetical protein J4E90_003695 [Alternaria incomplexa]
MTDQNQHTPSSSWVHVNITTPPEAPAATAYALPLQLDGAPVATIQVLLPPGKGFVWSSVVGLPGSQSPIPQTLGPGATATVDGILISLDPKGSDIVFQRSPSVPAQTATSTLSPSPNVPAPTSLAVTPAPTNPPATGTTPTNSASSPPGVAVLPQSKDPGLSTGAIAGIAIGCLFAGALLAGIILWFCWRKKRQSKNHYPQPDTYALASQEKGFSANTIPLAGKRSSVAALGGGLPQPLEDKAISGDVSKISNAIKNHVQSYYHTNRVNPGLIDYEDLHALGPGLPVSVGTLTTLIGNAATREIALRFIIAWVIVSKLQPSKDPSKSLLPSEVAQCYQAVATGDRGYQGMRHEFLRLLV